jgi:curved DNA-binding protein CbpA
MKAMRAHPDLGGDEEFAKTINEAYDTLKDPERRASYDESLRQHSNGSGEPSRRAPRTRIDAAIAICTTLKGNWEDATVVDASSLGMKIRSRLSLESGQHLAIAFPGSCAMAAEATVTWAHHVKGGSESSFEAGVEFFSPIPDILRRLRRKSV